MFANHRDGIERGQMRDQETSNRRKLNLGIDAIGTVDTILCWDKLELCFGASFRFSTEAKFEITRELAIQQARLQKLLSKKNSAESFSFQENAKTLSEKIERIIETNDKRTFSFISDILNREGVSDVSAFCDVLKALGSAKNVLEPVRQNDLFRDIIRKIVKVLLKESIPLSLHVQSTLNKFMTELDRQLPETIFPISNARYIEEGRIRILKDYLRGYLRSNT